MTWSEFQSTVLMRDVPYPSDSDLPPWPHGGRKLQQTMFYPDLVCTCLALALCSPTWALASLSVEADSCCRSLAV